MAVGIVLYVVINTSSSRAFSGGSFAIGGANLGLAIFKWVRYNYF